MSPRRSHLEPRQVADGAPSSPSAPASDGGRCGCASERLLKVFATIVLLGAVTLCLDFLLKGRGDIGLTVSTKSIDKTRNSTMTVTLRANEHLEIIQGHQPDNSSSALDSVTATTTKMTTLAIVCQLSGEFGNNIGKFVHAYVLRRKLERLETARRRRRRFRFRIILRHQLRDKWIRARDDAQRCFPTSLGRLDFARGNEPDFDVRLEQQRQLHWMEQFEGVNVSPLLTDAALRNFTRIAATAALRLRLDATEAVYELNRNASESAISLPFLWSDAFAMHPTFAEFVDEYYHEIRNLLKFDSTNCCALLPDPDETVMHHRNFLKEMPRTAIRLGFQELGPDEAADRLLGHLQSGDKVAIVSRFGAVAEAPLLQALRRRGLRVRLVQNQTGVQDFCFLMHARKELIGPGKSTFFFWAALLGNASRVRSYWVDTPEVRTHIGGDFREDYVWRTPELKERFRIELHPVDGSSGPDGRM